MRVVLLVVLFSLLSGCPQPSARVRHAAAEDFDCPETDIEVSKRSTGEAWVAKGCHRQGVFQCEAHGADCFNLLLMARQRAAREHSCAVEDVRVQELSPFVFMTEGCGFRSNYHCEMIGGVARCMLEADERRASDRTD